ncbi:MAG TPA: hypothetical protein G4O00_06605 [Thermoflexia bacterium]|nr:hypothetical protein [Thermoflexia bacterium]
MDGFRFWQRWLMGVGGFLVLFGLGMVLLEETAVFAPFHTYIDPVFWPGGRRPPGVPDFQRWAWNCAFVGLLVWFLPDAVVSLCYRVYLNAGLNAFLFVLAIFPLLFTRGYFRCRDTEDAERTTRKTASSATPQ